MHSAPLLKNTLKALARLGPRALFLYARYKLGLKTGRLRKATPEASSYPSLSRDIMGEERRMFDAPRPEELASTLGSQGADRLALEAEEIIHGKVRLFGGEPVPLQLIPPGPLAHWTEYENGARAWGVEDVKFIWEPGRFGWAYTLARAYRLNGDERYAHAFWEHTQRFLDANPPNLGPHWASGQEVALRLVAFVFALQVFGGSPASTPERVSRLLGAIAVHAARIPPTLDYARAQNNNHLLTEAVGLLTAGLALPRHPEAKLWRSAGWRWLNAGLQAQISDEGVYCQHSVNYHRLMLQTALWANLLLKRGRNAGLLGREEFPQRTRIKLSAALSWLQALLDPHSGQAPNLGPNDGAYILPLTTCSFSDYRPVLQAGSLSFSGERAFPCGPWDEMARWLSGAPVDSAPISAKPPSPAVHILRSAPGRSWAYVRAANFTCRPGHADQLHMDTWWRGLNVALDAGTYLYNAPPPWENALSHSAVHNTITLDGEDQMTRAGRFLWLDWAQAAVIEGERYAEGAFKKIAVQHDGYRRLGVIHRREVHVVREENWLVIDRLLPLSQHTPQAGRKTHLARLHWLLPDWPWEIESPGDDSAQQDLLLHSPLGVIGLRVAVELPQPSAKPHNTIVQIVRAGELLYGSGPVSPNMGWVSPTYAQKEPALSFSVERSSPLPLTFTTRWSFPDERAES